MRAHSVNVYVNSKEYITFRRKIYIYHRIDIFFKPMLAQADALILILISRPKKMNTINQYFLKLSIKNIRNELFFACDHHQHMI